MKRNKVLIIPDVHGRDFWKNPVEKNLEEFDNIIFLGDYLDPYTNENISFKEALENFKKIIDLKKENRDKVILLYGNHDCHYCNYLSDNIFPCSRYNEQYSSEVNDLFNINRDLFRVFYKIDKYLFSHAGVCKEWMEKYCGFNSVDELINNESTVYNKLWVVSRIRGGWENFGSCVWSDVRDFTNNITGIYQIFGHTQLSREFFGPMLSNEKNFACLDCRKCFVLDLNENKIYRYEN